MRSSQSGFAGRPLPRNPLDAWEARLRASRAIQSAATELKDLVRHARSQGIPISCEIDWREINIADLTITINMRTTRAPPET